MTSNIYKSGLLILLRWLDSVFAKLPRLGRFRPLRGVFSAVQALEKNRLHGDFLLRAQDPGPCQAGSLTDLVAARQHDHQPWPIFWVRSDDARLVGKMLYWRDRRDFLCSEGAFNTPKRRRLKEDHLFAQVIPSKPLHLPGAWTSIVSNWGNGGNYFHWFCDSLTRLPIREQLPEETRILIPANPTRFVKETLEMLGLTEYCTEAPAKCLQPERYYFCSPTAMTGVWNPIGFDWLREKFSPFFAPETTGAPVFLTRRGTARVPPNIAEIEALFLENGFEIVDCGQHSVQDQIRILSSAPAVAGLHGAAMTNLLWVKPGAPVLEIFGSQYLNACYEQIALQGKLPYQFIIGDSNVTKDAILNWLENYKYQ